ncbi:MAG TPA: class A beta-lactamase-related serine hydrolase [Bacteroidales bacterium]|nr:class A beta-lactamase-related serine hydrolase [Bacteroidales bacterium]HPS61406.1 class A beta-lactamase-related serine hydrolase [Bacteroidales bacterium]
MKKHNPVPPDDTPPRRRMGRLGYILMAVVSVLLMINILLLVRKNSANPAPSEQPRLEDPCSLDIVREKSVNDRYVDPLLLVDINSESTLFSQLKARLLQQIQQAKSEGSIREASVYLKDMATSGWMGIDCESEFLPGSLMKVPVLLYYLRQEQEHPGTLKTRFAYEKPQSEFPSQEYKGESIRPGKSYTVEELLSYMIDESDNSATYILSKHLDHARYNQYFTDFGIAPYEAANTRYTISPRQYSKFFRLLYNATFINRELSAYALRLMTDSKFRDGLIKELPADIPVAHKFGERGMDNTMDFSESGIIYYHHRPYILTIMTRGSDAHRQAGVLSELSLEVFKFYKRF